MTADRRVVAITGAGGALGTALSARFAGEPSTDVVNPAACHPFRDVRDIRDIREIREIRGWTR